jgi:hypothetical protein
VDVDALLLDAVLAELQGMLPEGTAVEAAVLDCSGGACRECCSGGLGAGAAGRQAGSAGGPQAAVQASGCADACASQEGPGSLQQAAGWLGGPCCMLQPVVMTCSDRQQEVQMLVQGVGSMAAAVLGPDAGRQEAGDAAGGLQQARVVVSSTAAGGGLSLDGPLTCQVVRHQGSSLLSLGDDDTDGCWAVRAQLPAVSQPAVLQLSLLPPAAPAGAGNGGATSDAIDKSAGSRGTDG